MSSTPSKNATQIREARNSAHPYLTPPVTPATGRRNAIKAKAEGDFRTIRAGLMNKILVRKDQLQDLEETKTYIDKQMQLMECLYCREVMETSQIIDCGHEFCEKCLREVKWEHWSAKDKAFKAPKCPLEGCRQNIMYGPWGKSDFSLYWFGTQGGWKTDMQFVQLLWYPILRDLKCTEEQRRERKRRERERRERERRRKE
ncbi:hypothetical protein V5O48_017995 [Marasmius crinis-equi]|uniref:RING-type domain-containing protein n=1 Tax=Marasmius crinis-equi TaxID=585013 RepID=A0ABR3EMJ6_9AGAR